MDVGNHLHWTQTFPPGKVVEIRHEYTPWPGGENWEQEPIETILRDKPDACPDAETAAALSRTRAAAEEEDGRRRGGPGLVSEQVVWIDYILTTANSWKTPIRDFELTVEARQGWVASFCWQGPVERFPDGRLKARATDFVPRKELRVYFIGML